MKPGQLELGGWYYIKLTDGSDAIVPAVDLAKYYRNPIKSLVKVEEPKAQGEI